MKDWKKKLSMPLLSAGLVFSAFAPGVFSQGKLPAPVLKSYSNEVAPVDLAIANDERLIEMLKKNGTIAKDATPAEADQALQQYLHKMALASGQAKSSDSLSKKREALKEQIKGEMNSNGIMKGKGNKLGNAKQDTVASVQKEPQSDQLRKDKILVLLIDYPDLARGQIKAGETDMYYNGPEAYSKQHFQDMIFGDDGYTGPDGEKKVSMKQYYEAQSGGTYTVEGEVAGWYTAKHDAAYYGAHPSNGGNDARPKNLVYEALLDAANDPNVDLSKYDQEDPFDLDGDGDTREPDGIIDHLMVLHSGVGEEAGGGVLGPNAIWSHSWDLGGVATIPNTTAKVPYWGGALGAFNYTIEPEDGAAGVFAHEYGHDLGLPDEYDSLYSGSGEPISYWSIMSTGSWTGKVPGTEPSGFSPYDKEYLQNSMTTDSFTPNWQTGTTININDLTSKGTEILLDEAATKGTNNDVVRVDLPKKVTIVNKPVSGQSEYFSGSGNDLNNSMSTKVDLTNAKSAQLTFKTWYSIEEGYDFASIKVDGATIPGNITTTKPGPDGGNPGNGITGTSNGWVDATFDLTPYVGKEVTLSFNYNADPGVALPGFYVDDINVTADGSVVLSDNAEGTSPFTLNGFSKSDGKSKPTSQYYLLEWRTQNGTDAGLANVNRKGTMVSFDQGLLVWYVDESYDNNWTGPGYHPGDGFLGIVDADQHNNIWHYKDWKDPNGYYDVNKLLGSNSYQMHDAAFSLNKGSNVTVGDPSFYLKDNFTQSNALFDDSVNYLNPQDPDVGRDVPKFGLKVRVVGQSADGTVGKILLYR